MYNEYKKSWEKNKVVYVSNAMNPKGKLCTRLTQIKANFLLHMLHKPGRREEEIKKQIHPEILIFPVQYGPQKSKFRCFHFLFICRYFFSLSIAIYPSWLLCYFGALEDWPKSSFPIFLAAQCILKIKVKESRRNKGRYRNQ